MILAISGVNEVLAAVREQLLAVHELIVVSRVDVHAVLALLGEVDVDVHLDFLAIF